MNSLEIREFSQSIINHVNSSPLPIEIKRLALLDIVHQVEEVTNVTLKNEISARDAEKEGETDGEAVPEDRMGEPSEQEDTDQR